MAVSSTVSAYGVDIRPDFYELGKQQRSRNITKVLFIIDKNL